MPVDIYLNFSVKFITVFGWNQKNRINKTKNVQLLYSLNKIALNSLDIFGKPLILLGFLVNI